MAKHKPLLLKEILYIRKSYQTTTVPDMAEKLGRGDATIYTYMRENDLKPYRKPLTHTKKETHPFRVKNRRLEQVILSRKIENRKYNPR